MPAFVLRPSPCRAAPDCLPAEGEYASPLIRVLFEGEDDTGFDPSLPESFNSEVSTRLGTSSRGRCVITIDDTVTVRLGLPRDEGMDETELLRAILTAADEAIDFSRYDKNDDGAVDAVYIEYAGESGEWSTLFWPHRGDKVPEDLLLDGKSVRQYVFFGSCEPLTLLHETGHLLGLPDLYDFRAHGASADDIGTNDMMRDNTGDFNAVFKYLLGWIDEDEVTVVESSRMADGEGVTVSLVPMNGDAAGVRLLILTGENKGPYSEYLAAEYVTNEGAMDTADFQGEKAGFRVYAVRACLNSDGTDFLYDDNGGGRDKLIRALHVPEYASCALNGALFTAAEHSVSPATQPSTAVGSPVTGYTGFTLSDFDAEKGTFTVTWNERVPADNAITLTGETDGLSGTLELTLLSDRDAEMRDGVSPYLTDGKESYDVLLTAPDSSWREFRVLYTDASRPLAPDTDYTLIFPAGMFLTDPDACAPEIQIPVRTGSFGSCRVVSRAGDAMFLRSNAIEGENGLLFAQWTMLGTDTEPVVELMRANEGGEAVARVTLSLPDFSFAVNAGEPGLARLGDNYILSLSDDSRTVITCFDDAGSVIDSVTLDAGARVVCADAFVYAYGYDGDTNRLYAWKPGSEPVSAALPFGAAMSAAGAKGRLFALIDADFANGEGYAVSLYDENCRLVSKTDPGQEGYPLSLACDGDTLCAVYASLSYDEPRLFLCRCGAQGTETTELTPFCADPGMIEQADVLAKGGATWILLHSTDGETALPVTQILAVENGRVTYHTRLCAALCAALTDEGVLLLADSDMSRLVLSIP